MNTQTTITPSEKRRGRPAKVTTATTYVPSIINFDKITKLNNLDIDPKMLESMKCGISNMDEFVSHEEGIPCASNIMVVGDPGVGKTTVLLDVLSGIARSGRRCLFISGEMGHKQMYKYTQRFPQFGNIETLFLMDYLEYNTKDVIEQVLSKGWDLVLIDSVAEVLDGVRDDNGWDRKMAESWFVEVCISHNKGLNDTNLYSSFLLIQQVTKGGVFVGSNKLKHLTDAMLEMRRESERNGGGTHMFFSKNRNGDCGYKMTYQLNLGSILYGALVEHSIEE